MDREKLVFLPIKHPDLYVAANLAWIEVPHPNSVFLTSLDHSFLRGFTDLELMILYKHTVGEVAMCYGDRLRQVLFDIADRIPVREVNAFEVDLQAGQVPEQRSDRYLYAFGQTKPARQMQMFEHPKVEMEKAPNENEIAARAPLRAPVPPPPAPGTTPAASASAQRSAAPRAPRQHGVREIVWGVADRLWEAAGKPSDLPTVLKLRREMMAVLEKDHAVKKTTSSNELGAWQKTRL